MTRYILKRILQAIPLLLIISIVLFFLMRNMGDPIAAMAGRSVTRSADRARLTRIG
jgi:ABC-type dipeptide/oligopeptide/nickel transport system permease component